MSQLDDSLTSIRSFTQERLLRTLHQKPTKWSADDVSLFNALDKELNGTQIDKSRYAWYNFFFLQNSNYHISNYCGKVMIIFFLQKKS